MLHLNVLQNQWLIFALVGGAAIVIATILLFMAFWQPREEEEAPEAAAPVRRSFMPWVIILIFGATAAFMAAYLLRAALRPPNW